MKLANSRINSLKEMLKLAERRVSLETELQAIEERISALSSAVSSGSSEYSAAAPAKGTRQPSLSKSSKRNPRGLLKDKIMTALEAAGSEGVRVKELADALGQKPVNVHSWFHSNVQRNPAIEKVSGGHYRLSGKAQPSAAKPAAKSGQKAKSGGAGRKARGKRGALGAQILEMLKGAGSEGVAVSDIADKLGVNYKNIYVWFATTGKKNSAIKKVGPAKYTLEG